MSILLLRVNLRCFGTVEACAAVSLGRVVNAWPVCSLLAASAHSRARSGSDTSCCLCKVGSLVFKEFICPLCCECLTFSSFLQCAQGSHACILYRGLGNVQRSTRVKLSSSGLELDHVAPPLVFVVPVLLRVVLACVKHSCYDSYQHAYSSGFTT